MNFHAILCIFIFNLQVWDDIPEEAKNFVDVCLDKNQDSRPTSSDLLHHAWLGKHTTMNSIKANLEKMNNLSRRTSHVSSSHPRSIAVAQSTRTNSNLHHNNVLRSNHAHHHNAHKKPFLPSISKSPTEEPMFAQKRFKSGDFSSNSLVSPPHALTRPHYTNNNHKMENNIMKVSPPHNSYQIQHNNSNSTNSTNNTNINNSNTVPLASVNNDNDNTIDEEEAMESEVIDDPRLKTCSITSNEATFILPKRSSSKIITKEDLIYGYSSGESVDNRKDSIMTCPGLPDDSNIYNKDQIMTSFAHNQFPSAPAPHFMPTMDLFQVSNSMIRSGNQSGNRVLPPLNNVKCNTLFTPLKLEKMIESTLVSEGTNLANHNLDDLFTAPKFRRNLNPGFLRRSRSSSPSNPIHRPSVLPSATNTNRSTKKDPEKVQSWLNSVPICPRVMDADHPKFCKMCVEGKSLAKSF